MKKKVEILSFGCSDVQCEFDLSGEILDSSDLFL
jgi:hypothetical protein